MVGTLSCETTCRSQHGRRLTASASGMNREFAHAGTEQQTWDEERLQMQSVENKRREPGNMPEMLVEGWADGLLAIRQLAVACFDFHGWRHQPERGIADGRGRDGPPNVMILMVSGRGALMDKRDVLTR